MSVANAENVALQHVASLGDALACRQMLLPDATLTLMDSGERFLGRDEICAFFTNLHNRLFAAQSHVQFCANLQNRVAIEAQFEGTHQGVFAGLQPAGATVSAKYALVYDIERGAIAEIRAYWSLDALVRQLRGGRHM